MRKIREVLRLRFELKLGYQQIGRSCAIAVSTVHKYLTPAEVVGLSWPLPADWDETKVEAALFPRSPAPVAEPKPARTPPDFAVVHEQLRSSKYVTLQLLWEEYRQGNPDGYRYSRFCELYQRWRSLTLHPHYTETCFPKSRRAQSCGAVRMAAGELISVYFNTRNLAAPDLWRRAPSGYAELGRLTSVRGCSSLSHPFFISGAPFVAQVHGISSQFNGIAHRLVEKALWAFRRFLAKTTLGARLNDNRRRRVQRISTITLCIVLGLTTTRSGWRSLDV